jgi:hypothetical protein
MKQLNYLVRRKIIIRDVLYCVFQLQPEQPDSFLDLYKVFSSRESAELFIKTIKEEMPNTKWIWESWRLHK